MDRVSGSAEKGGLPLNVFLGNMTVGNDAARHVFGIGHFPGNRHSLIMAALLTNTRGIGKEAYPTSHAVAAGNSQGSRAARLILPT